MKFYGLADDKIRKFKEAKISTMFLKERPRRPITDIP